MKIEKKSITGKVVSDKMEKTAIISTNTFVVHPLYKKRMIRRKRYTAENTIGAKIGQTVKIVMSRPLSKTKRWKIIAIIDVNEK